MGDKNTFRCIGTYRTEIMGVAALLIFVFHEWLPVFGGVPILPGIEKYVTRFGFVGVDIFFFLSGMGLVNAMEKYPLKRFYRRRLGRVLPPYLIAAVFYMFYRHWGMGEFLKNLLGYHFFTRSIYSLLWFVPAILTVYLLFPLYYHVFKTSNHKIQFTAMVFLVWLLISMLFANRIREDMFGFTNRIPVFLTGVLLGWIVRERESEFTTISWAICVLALLLGLLLAYKTNYENMDLLVRVPNCCFPNLLMSVSGSCLLAGVFSLLDSHAVIVGRSLRAFFAFFGRMSLEFYCVQELLGEIIRKDILPGRGNPVTNVAVFAASTLAALALHHLCRMVITIGEKQRTGTPA